MLELSVLFSEYNQHIVDGLSCFASVSNVILFSISCQTIIFRLETMTTCYVAKTCSVAKLNAFFSFFAIGVDFYCYFFFWHFHYCLHTKCAHTVDKQRIIIPLRHFLVIDMFYSARKCYLNSVRHLNGYFS